jgi:diacylglycerol kinase
VLRLARSFRFAVAGLLYLFRTQPNFRIEIVLGILAVGLGVVLRINAGEWAILATVIALVLILEGLNTSLELAIDLASPSVQPKAKAAKDIAAGMVLVAAAASVLVGIALFVPRF